MSASMMSAYIPCSGRAATSIFRSRMSGRALSRVARVAVGARARRGLSGRGSLSQTCRFKGFLFDWTSVRVTTRRDADRDRTALPGRRDPRDRERQRDARPDTINHILTRPPPWDDTPHDATELNDTARHLLTQSRSDQSAPHERGGSPQRSTHSAKRCNTASYQAAHSARGRSCC